jgi:hypothetical protein
MAMQNSRKRAHFIEPTIATIGFVFRKAPILLWIGLPPALLSLVATYAIYQVWVPGVWIDVPGASRLPHSLAWVEVVVNGICATLFAVGVHRLVLRQELAPGIPVRLRRYEVAYAGTLIMFAAVDWLLGLVIVGVANALPDGAFQLILTPVAVLIVIFGIWVHVRLALVFPHAALTGRIEPPVSWRAMKGHVENFLLGGLALALFCTAVEIGFLIVFVWAEPYWPNAPWTLVARSLAMIVVWGLVVAMLTAYVSYTYQALVPLAGRTDAESREPAPTQIAESTSL